MNAFLLVFLPLLAAVAAFFWPDERRRPLFLPITATVHLALCLRLLLHPVEITPESWFGFDALAAAMLPVVSLLFFACSLYAVPYLRLRAERPNRVFVSCLLAMLGLISAGHQALHLGFLWIAVESVTLVCVPLLHFNGSPRAFEATWKYLLIGGTGIALALLGSFFLGYASLYGGGEGDLTFVALLRQGPALSRPWVLAAWVLLLTGYGTKMGLAPMHTWKPDAYGEASGIVGALLAGGVTSVAFSAILRIRAVVTAAGAGETASRTLIFLGLFSMACAALFLLGTRNYKRMLAYSSIEHMGILSLAAGLGPIGTLAALFHVWTNALTKGAIFLAAGNLHRAVGTAETRTARGLARLLPVSSALLVIGMFAVTACPPFGPFFSELAVLRAVLETDHPLAAVLFLCCLLLAFLGLSRVVFGVVDGRPSPAVRRHAARFRESRALLLPPILLLLLSLLLGLFTPAVLTDAWTLAVHHLFPQP